MAFILKDRVKEFTTTTGTGNISLSGAVATFDTFQSYLSNGDTTFYALIHTSSGVDEWEVGLATWNTGNTLSRTTVLAGSNGTSVVDFSAGTKDVFMTLPADKLLHLDANGNVDINGGTIDGTVIGAAQAAASNFTTVDATGNVSVGGQLDVSDWIDLAAQASHPAHGEGRLWYDNVHKTINYYSDDAGVVHELGIEEHARVYNETGATLSKGTPVYFAGTKTSNGTYVPTVAAANATSSTKYKSEGMIAADVTNNSYGYIITAGRLEGIDTSHLSIGQFFTGITDGATQTAAPVYPNFPMCLGFVVRSDATNGVVFLAQQNHSIKSFRVQMDQHIGGSLTIDGDLNVTGSTNTTSTSDVTAGAPFYRANEGDAIGDSNTTFTGSGLDDAFFAGHFTGTTSTTYYVKIDSVGTPDTFAVSIDNFSTTISTGNAITGSEQMIHSADNISVKFGATTGHTLNDVWAGTASPVNTDTGFFSNRNTGTSGVGYTHMGLFYDASDSKWRLVDEYDPVPAGTINTSHSSYVAGTIAANVEGNVTGNITGNASGNAATASALETARTIGGVSFDGTANINLAGVNTTGNQDTTGNAATATALETARTIQVSGDVTGSASFDGTSSINITTTVQDDSHAHIISNVDGLQSALDAKVPTSRTITAGNGLTGGGDLSANRTLTVGGGTGITVNANDIAIGQDVATTANVTFNNITVTGTVDGRDVAIDGSKLDGIESGATADQTAAQIRAKVEAATDSNVFTDADHSKLNGIEAGATGDQTNAEIRSAVEAATDSNVFTDADHSKLNGIEANAKNDQTITAGGGLTGGGTGDVTISHSDTSSQASVNNSGGTVIQDVTVDTYGHVTGLTSYNLDGRYYTETEADSRFVNVTGDTMTGDLQAAGLYVGATNTSYDFYNNGTTYLNGATTIDANTQINGHLGIGGTATDASWGDATYGNTEVSIDGGGGYGVLHFRGDGGGSTDTRYSVGVGDSIFYMAYDDVDGIHRAKINASHQLILNEGSGDVRAFHDNYHPNADTLTTARTINGVSFNGSANITIADSTKLPLAGGTVSGNLTVNSMTFKNNSNVSRNLKIQPSSSTTDVGLSMFLGNGSHSFQLYGTSTQYGFLDGNWAGWDIRKTKNGAFEVDEGGGLQRVFNDGYHPNADTLTTARTINGVSFNGSANITVADSTKLPLSGGTVTGDVGFSGGAGAITINANSDIRFTTGTWTGEHSGKIQYHNNHFYFQAAGSWLFRNSGGSDVISFSNGGNITLSGTVDGRDVAADGTKLDTIATNANNYSFPYTVSASASNSTVVQRHSSGYIFANYFNTTPNDIATGSITKICAESGNDGYIRHATAAAVRSFINVADGANVGIPLSGGTFTGNVSFGSNNITQVDNISVMNRIYHYADTNTYIQFYNDEIQIWPGGKQIALFTASANWYDGSVRFQNVGDVNVGVSGQSCELRVTGNVIAYYSDERLKTKTGNIENALDKVNSLEGFYYVENDLAKSLGYNNSLTQVALSAQQVQEVMPECVSLAPFDIADQRDVESRYAEGRTSRSGEDYLTVDYGKLVPLLVESIKELTARVEELENATT